MSSYSYVFFFSLVAFGASNISLGINLYAAELTFSREDESLRNALLNRDLAEFRDQIETGANPTQQFNNSYEGWVFCAATEVGREDYLKLIIDAGFDVNYRQAKITTELSTPLFCAITFKNLSAVEMLLNAGADHQVLYCPTCNSTIATSALWLSTLGMNFEMSIWLLKNTSYSTDQLQAIVTMIETLRFPKDSPRHPVRNEFVELLRAEGFSVTPWHDENF